MEDERNDTRKVSPLGNYLLQEERAHGRKSREIFRAQDLRDSLVRKSSESLALKAKDAKGKEAVKGHAKVRYEGPILNSRRPPERVFSVSEVKAFSGRFSGDALYTPGRDEEWNWGDFPTSDPPLNSLVKGLSNRIHGAMTVDEMSEVQAMVERAVAEYLALEKTQRLMAEIDKAEDLVDREWTKELAMYTAKFGPGEAGDSFP